MHQVVVIHGGDSFNTYEEYLSYLKNKIIQSPDYFKGRRDWKTTLQDTLGEAYEVFFPMMPNKRNARYIEWKIWFEKLVPFLTDNVVLIGHSLGASFLVRYLAEKRFPKRIGAVFLVSAAYEDFEDQNRSKEFAAPKTLELFQNQVDKIFLYQSKDDPVIPFSELAKYQAALPNATARVFTDRGHFNQDTFPELIADIKSFE